MGLSYHFKLSASADKTPAMLESFLKTVESSAIKMGFAPTMVLDARFDSEERRSFAKRLTKGLIVEDDKLKGVVVLPKDKVWSHDSVSGYCRIIPERGVALIVTDERKCESVFGFFKYPSAVLDMNQRAIVSTGVGTRWVFSDFVDSPDPRYREIVKLFAAAGYVEAEKDEFGSWRLPPPPQRPPIKD